MNTLRRWKQQVEKLEQKTGTKPGPQLIYMMEHEVLEKRIQVLEERLVQQGGNHR